MPYELLEHTADAMFRATGATLEEAMQSAIQAMAAIATDPDTVGADMSYAIKVGGKDAKELLFNLIDEVLFIHDTQKLLAKDAKQMRITRGEHGFTLSCTLIGDNARLHPGNLKAATYSDMIAEQLSDGTWLLQAVIDI
jgi:SHS2 domain-containing protein